MKNKFMSLNLMSIFNHKFTLLVTLLFMFSTQGFTQNIGDTQEFGPIIVSLKANWVGTKPQKKERVEIFNFNQLPPGYVLTGNRVQLFGNGKNNASYSLSMIAGGSNYIERHEITETYESLIELAVDAGDFAAAAQLRQMMNSHLSTYDQFTATNNTLRVYAEAHAIGSVVNRISGWIDLKVFPVAMYIGNPNPQILMQQIRTQVPIRDLRGGGLSSPVDVSPNPVQLNPVQVPLNPVLVSPSPTQASPKEGLHRNKNKRVKRKENLRNE